MSRKRSAWPMGETFDKANDSEVELFPCCKDDGTICGMAGQCDHPCKKPAPGA